MPDPIIVQIVQEAVNVEMESPDVINTEIIQEVVEVDLSGGRGPQGIPGASTSVTKLAGEILSSLKVVMVDLDGFLYYADKDNPDHADKVLGITSTAVLVGEAEIVHTYSALQDPSFAFDMDKPIYLGNNGLMTQTYPTTGFALQIGFPLAADSMMIDIKIPIIL